MPHLRCRIRIADRRQLALAAAERPRDVAPGHACNRGAVIQREAAGGRGERAAGRSEGAGRLQGNVRRCDTTAGRARACGCVARLAARFQHRAAYAVLSVCGARQGVHAGARKVRLRGVFWGRRTLIKVKNRKVVGHPRLAGSQERGGLVGKDDEHAVLVGQRWLSSNTAPGSQQP